VRFIKGWATLLALASTVAGCSLDIFDVVVELDARVLTTDFGQQAGTVPAVPCSVVDVDVCDTVAPTLAVDGASVGVPGEVTLALACDAVKGNCFAVATARPAVTVNVLTDDDFASRVARNATFLLRSISVEYTVPVNTLTFDVPRIDIYAGPEGTTRETDPDVVLVAMTKRIPANTPVKSKQVLTIPDDSEGLSFLEDSVENERNFVFLAVIAPRVEANQPVPSGRIELNVLPSLLLGLPR
jgi:hypothetical protein